MADRVDRAASETRAGAREAALREILDVIARSRDDEGPVFDAILDHACRLCNAPLAYLSMVTDDRAHVISPARRGAFARFGETLDRLRVPLGTSRLALARAISERRVIRVDDISDDEVYRAGDPNRVSMVEDEGARSLMVVPLLRDGLGIGSITLYRREVAPFGDDDVTIVETFAAQAVIAIENVHQFRELQTRLEREAATREILDVIARSRDDETPVFEVILKSAVALCDAQAGRMGMVDEARTHTRNVAVHNSSAEIFRVGQTFDLDASYTPQRAIRELRSITVDDLRDTSRYRDGDPMVVKMVDQDGARSLLAVPLISGGLGIGVIALNRTRLQPFTPNDIALVETFAAQAVIAIENVRQFKALEARTQEVQALNASLEARVAEQVGEIWLSPRAHIAVEDRVEAAPTGALVLKGIAKPVEAMKLRA